jgi:hypothetical protein
LPLSAEVCTPVSETGRVGALPAAAAIFNFNEEQTPRRVGLLKRATLQGYFIQRKVIWILS